MAFANLSLLVGSLLIGVPIALHLAMRPQPKRVIFPAIRFLKQRGESNRRQLQLRHWLLLGLRCLIVMALAAALARPSVATNLAGDWLMIAGTGVLAVVVGVLATVALVRGHARWLVGVLGAVAGGLALIAAIMALRVMSGGSAVQLGDEEAPVSAAIVIDTAPRMDYRYENRTRLEVARETATWLLTQLPVDSQIAIVETRPGPDVFAVDAAAARQTVERLQPSSAAQPVNAAIDRALRLLAGGAHQRRELYVLSDLSRAAWRTDGGPAPAEALQAHPDVLAYVVDVGAPRPQNFSLAELQLSAEILPRGGTLDLRGELRCLGPGGTRQVELSVEDIDPTRPVLQDGKPLLPASRVRGRQVVEVAADGAKSFEFHLSGLDIGTHHGRLRIVGEDGLPVDDHRYFTVQVADAWPVLVVAPTNVQADYFVQAVSPLEFRQSGKTWFDCREIRPSSLAATELAPYAALCLLDPPPLPPAEWERLAQFVNAGGGLALVLGHNAEASAAFQSPVARQLIGGKLARQWRAPEGGVFLAPRQFDHPILREFRTIATGMPWDQLPVYRHWSFDPLDDDARVLVTYGNNQPAIVERLVGKGRVLTMTTPLSDPARPVGRQAWNELPTAPDAWPFVVLADQMLQYLVGAGDGRLNLLAGQIAVLPQQPASDPPKFQLFTPEGQIEDLNPHEGAWTVRFTEQPGHYRLKGFRDAPVLRGFAVNLPAEREDLTRLSREELDQRLGSERYRFAATREEMDRDVGEARRGREFFPLLMIGVAIVLGLEQLLANRFYKPVEGRGGGA